MANGFDAYTDSIAMFDSMVHCESYARLAQTLPSSSRQRHMLTLMWAGRDHPAEYVLISRPERQVSIDIRISSGVVLA